MSWKPAALVSGAAFLLSFLCALIGGVSFLEIILRAFFLGVLAGAFTYGAEMLLRKVLPDLFSSMEAEKNDSFQDSEAETSRKVDITLEDEDKRAENFVEEVSESEEVSKYQDSSADKNREEYIKEPETDEQESGEVSNSMGTQSEPSIKSSDELPEMGSFLDSFKPQDILEGKTEEVSQETSDSRPQDFKEDYQPSKTPTGDVVLDGVAHDPEVLAKAVQTVMKKGQ